MKIEIQSYSESWPIHFEREAHNLRLLIALPDARIEHIGSTAVPGLSAKPIIDILVGFSSKEELDALPGLILKAPDYYYVPFFEDVMPFRRFFIRTKDRPDLDGIPRSIADDSWKRINHAHRICHIHAVLVDDPFFKEHLRFRDLLRSNDALRMDYENLKLKLANQQWESGADYAGAKSDFIQTALGSL